MHGPLPLGGMHVHMPELGCGILEKYDRMTRFQPCFAVTILLAGVASTVCTCMAALYVAIGHGDVPEWAVPIPMSFTSSTGPSKSIYSWGFVVTASLFLLGMPTFCWHYAGLLDAPGHARCVPFMRLLRRRFYPRMLACTGVVGVGLALQGIITLSEAPAHWLQQMDAIPVGSNTTATLQMSMWDMAQNMVHCSSAGVFFNGCGILYLHATGVVLAKAPMHIAAYKIMPLMVGVVTVILVDCWDWGLEPRGPMRQAGCYQWGMIISILVFMLTMVIDILAVPAHLQDDRALVVQELEAYELLDQSG